MYIKKSFFGSRMLEKPKQSLSIWPVSKWTNFPPTQCCAVRRWRGAHTSCVGFDFLAQLRVSLDGTKPCISFLYPEAHSSPQ